MNKLSTYLNSLHPEGAKAISNMAVVQSHSVFQMNTTEESDSSNDDVFIELADAWNYVKKWYNFRNKSDSNLNSGSRIKFTRSRAKASSNKLKLNEPSPSRVSFHDLPVSLCQSWLFYGRTYT